MGGARHRLRAPDLRARQRTILAATLPAELPELGTLNCRKIAALAGLALVAKDSGLRENRRVVKGGRGPLRRALYMPAVANLTTDKGPPENPLRTAHRRQILPSSP